MQSNRSSGIGRPGDHSRRGILLIVSSPSGAGKTTLVRRLIAEFPTLEFSVSFTTRTPRKNEVDGQDYYFVDHAEFDRMIAAGELAEWAEVHGNRYGTSRAVVERALAEGRDVVFDIDWQGGKALSSQWPDDVLKVFILPPSLDSLAERLRRRATDDEQVIQRRLHRAVEEMTHYDEYQDLIVNDDLDEAYQVLRALYLVRRYGEVDRSDVPHALSSSAERVRVHRMTDAGEHARRLVTQGRASSQS